MHVYIGYVYMYIDGPTVLQDRFTSCEHACVYVCIQPNMLYVHTYVLCMCTLDMYMYIDGPTVLQDRFTSCEHQPIS